MYRDPIELPKELGEKYRIEGVIGAGGFSRVYLATHQAMNRRAAIKIFDPDSNKIKTPEKAQRQKARFEREARLVSKLQHPNTVTIFDFGAGEDGKLFLVMEYIQGKTLKEILKKEAPLDEKRALNLFLQLLQSLEEAHCLGVIHRDLKPANIMVARNHRDQEVVKVLDFGIAHTLSEPPQEFSEKGSPIFLGTPRFAAPEQFNAGALSFATDTFAVGALLWETLLGSKMVDEESLSAYRARALSPEPHRLPPNDDISPELAAIIEKAVQKRPEDRFIDAAAMLAEINAAELLQAKPPLRDPSPFTPKREILDPNITDPADEKNFFLTPSPPPLPGGQKRKKARGKAFQEREPEEKLSETASDVRLAREISELALETETKEPPPSGRGPQRERPRQSEISRPASAPGPPKKTGPRPSPITPIALIGAALLLVLLFIGAALFFFSSSDSPDPAMSTAEIEESEAEEAPRAQRRSPFTAAGIQAAMAASRWQIMDERPPIDLQRFQFHSLVITRGNITLDVTLYEVFDPAADREIIDQIRFPSEFVQLGHFIIRLNPRDEPGNDEALLLRQDLLLYGQLVLQQASP